MGSPRLLVSLVRLVRPGITVAVLLTGYAGMVLGEGGFPPLRLAVAALFALGFSSAGAVMLNGVMERDRDAGMVRLRHRVSALLRVGEVPVLVGGMALVVGGIAIAGVMLNRLTGLILLAAVVSYVVVYTVWLKRSSYGAVPGGIPGALPVLAGYAAIRGEPGADGLLLFLILFLWQPPHFWLLTLRHGDDYRRAGLPVPLVIHGTRYTIVLIRMYLLSLLPAILSLWLFGFCSWRYAVTAVACWLAFAGAAWCADRETRTVVAFRLSVAFLAVVCLSIIFDRGCAAG